MSARGSNRDLVDLRDRALVTIDFLRELARDPDGVLDQFATTVQRVFDAGSKRGLRFVVRDLEEWASGLPEQQREELENRLRTLWRHLIPR